MRNTRRERRIVEVLYAAPFSKLVSGLGLLVSFGCSEDEDDDGGALLAKEEDREMR